MRAGGAIAVAFASLAWAGTAFAADPGLVDQYVEDIPTAGGTHHSGGSAGPTGSGGTTAGPSSSASSSGTPAALSTTVKRDLYRNAGKDAKTLEEVATSPRYGAPSLSGPVDGQLEPASPSTLDAAVTALGGDNFGPVGLLVGLLATAAVAIGAAVSRRRA
jgi:hypothetical protein